MRFNISLSNSYFCSESVLALLELSPRCAMRNRRTWGYIADISKNTSANMTTPYQLTVAARVAYLRDGEKEFSFAWARAPTFTPNCLCASDVALQEGTPVFRYPHADLRQLRECHFRDVGSRHTFDVAAGRHWASDLYFRRGLGPAVLGALTFVRRIRLLYEEANSAYRRRTY